MILLKIIYFINLERSFDGNKLLKIILIISEHTFLAFK